MENLEETFYRQGFAKFPDSDFAALGLNEKQVADLKQIGKTEAQHVSLLQSALAQGGIQPVQACDYEFGFTDAKGMVQTAAVLENVGISAYLGAAPLLKDPSILGTAGSILTIEARHQSSIRVFGGQVAVPQAFDAALGPRAVFSLAAPFIKSCPQGSNLAVKAFPKISMDASAAANIKIKSKIQPKGEAGGATHCGFTSGGVVPGGTAFTPFKEGEGCEVPEGIAGVTYLSLTNDGPLDGALTDELVVAGPMIITIT